MCLIPRPSHCGCSTRKTLDQPSAGQLSEAEKCAWGFWLADIQCLMPALQFWHTQVTVPGCTEGLQRPWLKHHHRRSPCYASCVMSPPLHFSPLPGAESWDNTHLKQLREWQETWMWLCQKRVHSRNSITHVRNQRPKNIGVFKGIFGVIGPDFVPFYHNFTVHSTLSYCFKLNVLS